MPFFDEKRYKNGSETGGTLWLFCEVLSLQPIGINWVLERDFIGHKSFEIVQLLRGQCFGNCYKQQTYVAAVAIFKIALVVIFWTEKELLFLFLFKLLLSFYEQYIVCYL